MKRLIPILASAALLGACQSDTPRFNQMTESELYAYNEGRPMEHRVICRTETDTSTYIRKTRCQTIRQYINRNQAAAMAVEVLDFGRNYNQGIGQRSD